MTGRSYSPSEQIILGERERRVAQFRLERATRRASRQPTDTSRQSRSLSSLRHRLAVLCHLAQQHPSAPTVREEGAL
jgi:hypothetical protein